MISTTELVQIGSFLLASISVWVAVSLYIRNKNLEYKNHLYKTKLEAFSCIAYEMEKLLNYYNKGLVQLRELKNINGVNDLEEVKNFGEQTDDFVYEFSNKIVKYLVYFPESITAILYDLSHSQYSSGLDELDIDKAIILMEKFIDEQIPKMNTAYDLIRKDLKISEINAELFRK